MENNLENGFVELRNSQKGLCLITHAKKSNVELKEIAEKTAKLGEEKISNGDTVEGYKLLGESDACLEIIQKRKSAKKKGALLGTLLPTMCGIIAFLIVLFTVILPGNKYEEATTLFNDKKYIEAATLFEELEDYEDSGEKMKESLYLQAVIYRNEKNWDAANPLFERIKDYKDSANLLHYHKHSVTGSKKATCTAAGFETFKCSCGDSYTQSYTALGHNFSAATCTKAKKCSTCGKTEGKALGHTTNSGECSRCNLNTFKSKTVYLNQNKENASVKLGSGKYKITAKITAQGLDTFLGYETEDIGRFFASFDEYAIGEYDSLFFNFVNAGTTTITEYVTVNYDETLYITVNSCYTDGKISASVTVSAVN